MLKKKNSKFLDILAELKALDKSTCRSEQVETVYKKLNNTKFPEELKDRLRDLLFLLVERFRRDTKNPKYAKETFEMVLNLVDHKQASKFTPYLDSSKDFVDLRLPTIHTIAEIGQKNTLPENLLDRLVNCYFRAMDKKEDAFERNVALDACKTICSIQHPQAKLVVQNLEEEFPVLGKKIKKEFKSLNF